MRTSPGGWSVTLAIKINFDKYYDQRRNLRRAEPKIMRSLLLNKDF